MTNKNNIEELILNALKNINDERGLDDKIDINLNTCLFGENGILDSLSLVSVIVDIEVAASNLAGRDISLTDDREMSQEVLPFTNVQTLTEYILILLSEGL